MTTAATGTNETELDIAKLMSMGPMAPVANPHPVYAALRNSYPVYETTRISQNAQEQTTSSFIITRWVLNNRTLMPVREFANGR